MRKNIIVAVFLLFNFMANAQSSKNIKIAELLDTMGSTQAMKTSYEYMIEHYKKNYPDVPTEYWDKASKYVNYNELIEKLIPVYTKHFTEQEIESLITFYRSTTGKKMIDKMPLILQESMEIGRMRGVELAQKLEKEISLAPKKEYSSPPPPMPSK